MFECLGCGVVMPGRRARKYCSNACQRAAERRARIATWLATGVAPYAGTAEGHYIRRHIAQEQDGRCAICAREAVWLGRQLVLILDHVDGDSSNNSRENLRLVCPNCDSQLETYKNRNNGWGRRARRQRYANGQSY